MRTNSTLNHPSKSDHDYVRRVLFGGLGYIPPGNGVNYLTWGLVGFVFQHLLRRRNFLWWRKYNYVLSSALGRFPIDLVLSILIERIPCTRRCRHSSRAYPYISLVRKSSFLVFLYPCTNLVFNLACNTQWMVTSAQILCRWVRSHVRLRTLKRLGRNGGVIQCTCTPRIGGRHLSGNYQKAKNSGQSHFLSAAMSSWWVCRPVPKWFLLLDIWCEDLLYWLNAVVTFLYYCYRVIVDGLVAEPACTRFPGGSWLRKTQTTGPCVRMSVKNRKWAPASIQ